MPGTPKFGRGITVPCFIEEPSADLVADEGFCSVRAGQRPGLFLLRAGSRGPPRGKHDASAGWMVSSPTKIR
jgi:hypothetical protein